MRQPLDRDRLEALLRAIGARTRGPGRIYLCGGATALLHGWRASTIDVDLRLDPEPAGLFEAIAALKNELDVNIELAGPRDFVPALPGADDRAAFIGRFGVVDVFHEDYYGQALAKIARGHARDRADVDAMVARGLFEPPRLLELLRAVAPALLRYPALDADDLLRRVEEFARGVS
jgi:hypothetical protein